VGNIEQSRRLKRMNSATEKQDTKRQTRLDQKEGGRKARVEQEKKGGTGGMFQFLDYADIISGHQVRSAGLQRQPRLGAQQRHRSVQRDYLS
jgi:hypothetical protein